MDDPKDLPPPTYLWDRPEYPHYTPDQVKALLKVARLAEACIARQERMAGIMRCELSPEDAALRSALDELRSQP